MKDSPHLEGWRFNKFGAYIKKDGKEKEKKLIRKLEKIAKKIENAIKTFPRANVCILDHKGMIFHCNRNLKKDMLEFISTYVRRNHDIFPEGSYAIPRSDLSLVVWKLSESTAIVIHTESGIGTLLSATPYILHFSKKIEEIVVNLSPFPVEDYMTFYKDDEKKLNIFGHEVYAFISQKTDQENEKLLEIFGDKGINFLEEMDGRKTVQEIAEKTDTPMEDVKETIMKGIKLKKVEKRQQYPLVKRLNGGTLLLFGIDPTYTKIYKNLRKLCNGKRTLEEVSSILEIPESKLVNILERIGKHVEWIKGGVNESHK